MKLLLLVVSILLCLIVEVHLVQLFIKNNKKFSILTSLEVSTDQLERVQTNTENCICVEHVQCDKNFNLITGGQGIIDERIGANEAPKTVCPTPGEVCCWIPKGVEVPTAAPPATQPPATTPPPTTKPPAATTSPTTKPSAATTPKATKPPATTPPPTTKPPATTPKATKPPAATTPKATKPPATTPPPTTKPPATTPGTTPKPNTIPTVPPPAATTPPATTAKPAATPTTAKPKPSTPGPPGSQCGVNYIPTGRTETAEPFTTTIGEFPWMLAVLDSTAVTPEGTIIRNAFVAGASLIEKNIALTAAHKVKDFVNKPSELIIRAGEWNTVTSNEPLPHQDRTVQKIEIHNDFNNSTLYNDIALLKLEEPVVYANNVIPICLPELSQTFTGLCIATGWGQNAFGPDGKYQPIMRKVSLPIIDYATCQSQLRNTRLGFAFVLDPSFMCAGGQANMDTCTGDGGGPLICPNASGGFVQAGIVSWGIGCGGANVPGVYVDVGIFREWINSSVYRLNSNPQPRSAAA